MVQDIYVLNSQILNYFSNLQTTLDNTISVAT